MVDCNGWPFWASVLNRLCDIYQTHSEYERNGNNILDMSKPIQTDFLTRLSVS